MTGKKRYPVASVLVAILLVFACIMVPLSALAETDTTISELNETTQHQSRQVTVKGEVVGDILNAQKGYKWLLLLDGQSSISVLVTDEDALKVVWLGRYNQVGTTLEISGVFHADCSDHDGLTDIHATSVKVLEEGYKTQSSLEGHKIGVAVLLIVLGAALSILHGRLRERTR